MRMRSEWLNHETYVAFFDIDNQNVAGWPVGLDRTVITI